MVIFYFLSSAGKLENTVADNHERNEGYELKPSLKFIKMFQRQVFFGIDRVKYVAIFLPFFFILFCLFIYREMDNIDDPARISIFIALFYWERGREREKK